MPAFLFAILLFVMSPTLAEPLVQPAPSKQSAQSTPATSFEQQRHAAQEDVQRLMQERKKLEQQLRQRDKELEQKRLLLEQLQQQLDALRVSHDQNQPTGQNPSNRH